MNLPVTRPPLVEVQRPVPSIYTKRVPGGQGAVVVVVDVVDFVVVDVVGAGAGAAVCAYAGTPMAMLSAIARTNFTIGSLHSMSAVQVTSRRSPMSK